MRQGVVLAIVRLQGFSSQLDQYELVSTIGEGSCNPVWLATQRQTGMKVALKCMDSAKYQRLTREHQISEADAMRLCQNNAHVVTLVDEFEQDDKIYLATKYVQGGDLLCFMKSLGANALSENLTRTIISQVAKGLHDMHAAGIVHRDVKHLNIFIKDADTQPTIKIGDFGMASKLEENQCIEKVAGTVAFMAPEVVESKPSAFKADVWSLGIILHHLVSAKLPFSGEDRDATIEQILGKELSFEGAPWSSVHPQCKNLLLGMLTKNQNARLSMSQVLEHPWITGNL